MKKTINTSSINFLKQLAKNNNRDWFNKHKNEYLKANENIAENIDTLILLMNQHDHLENISGKKSLFRIYKDVRFSKDKTPFSARFAFALKRVKPHLRGGYYVNLKPGKSFMACGFFGPNSDDLKRIRMDIMYNYEEWNKILKSKGIKNNWGELTGEKVNTAPRGFDKNHPAIELLRHKQFIFRHEFKDKEILDENFMKEVNKRFKRIRPFFDYMSEVLTTNENGESIL